MLRIVTLIFALSVVAIGTPALAETGNIGAPTLVASTEESSATGTKRIGCASLHEATTTATAEGQTSVHEHEKPQFAEGTPKVVFKLNTAEDAPVILRFVTNYLAIEPTAQVAVVGYAGGIDFMLKDARDPNGKPYADQLTALTAQGVAFKVCNNTLKARNLTAAAVNPLAAVVPGAVNEIIRLQTKEGYAYFQN